MEDLLGQFNSVNYSTDGVYRLKAVCWSERFRTTEELAADSVLCVMEVLMVHYKASILGK